MRVSWYYSETVQPDQNYLSDTWNQEFIALVNAVHENRTGLTEDLKRKRQEVLSGYHECYDGRISSPISGPIQLPLPSLGNISDKPLQTSDVAEETFATAARLYFYFRKGFSQI